VTKPAAGAVIAPPSDAEERLPRRVRVYRTLAEAIAAGSLRPGARLPSARQLALEWGFSRGAVDEAYEQLQAEGLIERRTGDGSYVAAAPLAVVAPAGPLVRPLSQAAQRVQSRFSAYLGKPQRLELPVRELASQAMFPRVPMLDDFPLDAWRKSLARAHADGNRWLLNYGPAQGLPALREAIARHLQLARGTPCRAEQILILNSPTQAAELIARVLLEPGDAIWLEDPGHGSLVTLFETLHVRAVGVPFDAQGLDVARGMALAPDAAAVYLHPLTQFPLGVRTSTARRAELLRWAEGSGAWVVEGNFNDEFMFDADAPASLQSMDRSDRVLVMGTFEGIMFPSLRVAYLVLPPRLVKVFVAMRGLMGDHTNVGLQLALADFMDDGHLAARLRSLRRTLVPRREAMRAACERHLPAWVRPGPFGGGAHMSLHFPPDVDDCEAMRRMREAGVLGIALSSMCIDPAHANGVALGFGAFEPALIESSMRSVGAALAGLTPRPAPPAS